MKTIRNVAQLLPLLMPTVGLAASFDCVKATAQVEKTICANPALSQLDERLTTGYRAIIGRSSEVAKKNLRADEILWLKASRQTCGDDAACLQTEYFKRIESLDASGEISQVKPDLLFSLQGSFPRDFIP